MVYESSSKSPHRLAILELDKARGHSLPARNDSGAIVVAVVGELKRLGLDIDYWTVAQCSAGMEIFELNAYGRRLVARIVTKHDLLGTAR